MVLLGFRPWDSYGKASIAGEAAHAQKWIFCVRPLTQSAQSSATQIRPVPRSVDVLPNGRSPSVTV